MGVSFYSDGFEVVRSFNSECETYESFLLTFLEDQSGGNCISWRRSTVFADTFLTPKSLENVSAGSVLLVSSAVLVDKNLHLVHKADASIQDRLLTSPTMWALLNASQPLIIVMRDGGQCSVEWPSSTHHVIYISTWCARWHSQWRKSERYENGRDGGWFAGHWPWMRTVPFGTHFDHGQLDRLVNPRPVASERGLLFSFRGTMGTGKPSRVELWRDVQANPVARARLDAIADKIFTSRASPTAASAYPFGRYLLDIVPSPEDGSVPKYFSSEHIDYAESLQQSILTLCPPGDLWETYRTWEAIAAGAVPVLVDVSGNYMQCTHPSSHMRELTSLEGGWAFWLKSWAELPDLLEREMSNATALFERQANMDRFMDRFRTQTRRNLLCTSLAMREGHWRPRTSCDTAPHTPLAVAHQHNRFSSYWRRPQSSTQVQLIGLFGRSADIRSFRLQRARGAPAHCNLLADRQLNPQSDIDPWNDGGENFWEECITRSCTPALIGSLACDEQSLVAGDRRHVWPMWSGDV